MDFPAHRLAVSLAAFVLAFLMLGEARGEHWHASVERKGGETGLSCSWEDEGRLLKVEDSRFLWRGGDWSGILGQGSLGAWNALRRTPPYGPGSRTASPWSGNARFLTAGMLYKGEKALEMAMVMAKEKPKGAWEERRAGFFGVEAGAKKIEIGTTVIDSSIGFALAEEGTSGMEEGWSARLPASSPQVLHMGASTRIGIGAAEFEQWASARKDMHGSWNAAFSFGLAARPRLGQGVDFLFQAHAYGCGEGFRTLEGALPYIDRSLEVASCLTWETFRIKGSFRSLSRQGEADHPEISRPFDPSIPFATRLAWLWKTDILQARLELAKEKGASSKTLRCSASLDSGGLAWATAEAGIGFGLGVTGTTRLKADFGFRFSRLYEGGGDEAWQDGPGLEEEAYGIPSAPRIMAAELQYLKGALSCAWPGSKPSPGLHNRAVSLGPGRAELGVRSMPLALPGRERELSLEFSLSQKAFLLQDSCVELGISSPEGGYIFSSKGGGWTGAFPNLRLALGIGR